MLEHRTDGVALGSRSRQSRLRIGTAVLGAAVLVVSALSTTAPALTPAATSTTYAGPSYPAQPGFRASADKPQSKLWFADGHWWGLLQQSDGSTAIHALRPDHTWLSTGVVVDTRSNSTADAFWRGGKLYVASRVSNGPTYLTRYTDSAGTYTKDNGFPVTIATGGSESVTIDRDSTGVLWATYTQGSKVWVTNSTTDDAHWTAPYAPPTVPDVTVAPDDISALVSIPGAIAILWSDQQDGSFKVALHHDATNTWTNETAKAASLFGADDHINMKSFGEGQDGRLYVSVKTSNNDAANPSPTAPLLQLLTRSAAGSWSISTIATVADNNVTRPIVLLDASNQEIYVCYAYVTGTTTSELRYKKAVAGDAPVFPTGQGSVLAQATGADINDPSGTKDPITHDTGLVVLGSDMTNSRYYHAEMPIAAPPDQVAPTAPDTATATINISSSRAVDVTWTGSTDNVGVTGYRIFRDAGTTPIATASATPPLTFTDTGLLPSSTHTWSVAAIDGAGNMSAKTTTAPLTLPPDTTNPSPPSGLTATLLSTGPVTLSWSAATDDVGVTGYRVYRNPGTNPIATTDGTTLTYTDHFLTPDTTYTWWVTAVDAAGNESDSSNTAQLTTPVSQPPTTPTNLAVTGLSPTSVSLSWSASTDPNEDLTGYQLVRDGTVLPTVYSTTAATDSPGNTDAHVYGVVAVDGAANTSPVSASVIAAGRGGAAFRSGSSATGTGTTAAVTTAPSNLTAGDVLLASVVEVGNKTVSTPSGWTLVRTTNRGSSMRVTTFAQTVSANGSWSAASFPLGSSTSWTVVLQAWSGVRLASPVAASASATGNKATITAPALAATRSAAVLSLFAIAKSAGLSTAAPLTVIGSGTSSTSWLAGTEAATASATLPARTATATTSGNNIGTRIVLAPAVTQP